MKEVNNMSAVELIAVINKLQGILPESRVEAEVWREKVRAVFNRATELADEVKEHADALALKVLEMTIGFDSTKLANGEYSEETIDNFISKAEALVPENDIENEVLDIVLNELYEKLTDILTENEVAEYYMQFTDSYGDEEDLQTMTSEDIMAIINQRIAAPRTATVDEAVDRYNEMCTRIYSKVKAQEELDELTGSIN